MGIDDSATLVRCIFPSLNKKYLPRTCKSWTCDLQVIYNFFCGLIVADSRRLDDCPAERACGYIFWIFIMLFAAKLLQARFAEGVAELSLIYPQKRRLGLKKTS